MPKALKYRRHNVVSLIVSFLWLLATTSCSESGQEKSVFRQAKTKRPSIVLVVSDALRQDVLGCYGGEAVTPNIDALAENGVLFENAYATSPWTPPSSVSIFTGNYATSYPYSELGKTMQAHVPDEEVLFAEVLKNNGYDTALRPGNYLVGLHNCLQGFEILPNELWITAEAKNAVDRIAHAQIRDHFGYPSSYSILNRLLSIPSEKNFFVAQWIMDPHEPFAPVSKFASKIVVDQSDLTQPAETYTSWSNIKGEPSDAEISYLKARYLAEVESVDERVGYILRMLAHKQVLRTTYFIFTSDHGELFGEHDLFGHAVNYFEELVRVPLLIIGPGLPRGKRVKTAVSLVDLMPTLKDLLGIDYDDNMQGESFKDHIFNDLGQKSPLYFDDIREHARVDALLDNGFKLIALQDGTYELYDLPNDPGEKNNIAATREDKVRTMMQQILAMREVNKERQAAHFTKLDSLTNELSPEEEAELEKKLRALGYVN
jgi:choline-sulfatase